MIGRIEKFFLTIFLVALPVTLGVPASGHAQAKQGQAETYADRLSAALGGTSRSGRYLSALQASRGRFPDIVMAAELYWRVLEDDPDNDQIRDNALMYLLAAGRMENGFAVAERLIAKNSGHRLGNLALGVRSLKNREYEKARQHFDTVVKSGQEDLGASLLSAWAIMGSQGASAAIAAIDDLPQESWYQSFKDFHGGLMADVEGLSGVATQRLSAAYDVDGASFRAVEAYARRVVANGDRQKAATILRRYSQANENLSYLTRLEADLEKGRLKGTLVRTVQEGAAEALYGYGAALGNDGVADIGAMYLQFARYLDGDGQWVLFALADLFDTLKNTEQAIAYYEQIAPDSLLRRNADIKIGLGLYDMGKFEQARERLRKLIDENPADLEAIATLGLIFRDKKQFADAAKVYSRGIASIETAQAHHWRIYYHRGIAFERLKEWPKAEADFLKSLSLSKDQPLVLNYLGYSWIDQGMNLRRGLELIERAVALRPRDGYIVDSLGWAHYKLGNYEKAVEELERAVQLLPQDPTINDHLGDAYWQVGRRLEARFQWMHARDLKPEEDQIEQILTKIENGLGAPQADTASKKNAAGPDDTQARP